MKTLFIVLAGCFHPQEDVSFNPVYSAKLPCKNYLYPNDQLYSDILKHFSPELQELLSTCLGVDPGLTSSGCTTCFKRNRLCFLHLRLFMTPKGGCYHQPCARCADDYSRLPRGVRYMYRLPEKFFKMNCAKSFHLYHTATSEPEQQDQMIAFLIGQIVLN